MARYSDLNLDFTPHPMTGDVSILTDMNALSRSIRNLILTSSYDRPFRPEINSGVYRYLFEPMTSLTAVRIRNAIERTIKQQEPRVDLIDIVVTSDEAKNSFGVSIVFRPKNVRETGQVTLTLERLR